MIFRFFIFSFGGLLIFSSAFSQEKAKPKTVAAKSKHSGKTSLVLKSQNAYEFKFSLGEKKQDSSLLYIKKYNEKGSLIEDSSPGGKIVYKYNEKGKLILETSYNADNTVHYMDVYSYDSLENMKEKTEFENSPKDSSGSGKIVFKTASKYNPKSLEIEKTFFDSDGKIQSRQIFAYDAKGNKTEEADYDSASIQTGKKVLAYDVKNKIILMLLMKKDSVTAKYAYEYNEAGLKTKSLCYESDGSINYKTIYEYDTRKNLISENTYQSAGTTRTVWQYDTKGNKISEIKYDGTGNVLLKSTYRYNEKNRMSEETVYDLYDEPASAIKYYYEYFPGK